MGGEGRIGRDLVLVLGRVGERCLFVFGRWEMGDER